MYVETRPSPQAHLFMRAVIKCFAYMLRTVLDLQEGIQSTIAHFITAVTRVIRQRKLCAGVEY